MKENGIPKKTRFLWLVPFAGSNFGGGAAYICAVVYSRLFCKL